MAAPGEGFASKRTGNEAENIHRVLTVREAVSADSGSGSKQVFGHAHRDCADKFALFDFAKPAGTKAQFFIAHGSRDENVAARVIDSFALELLSRKRDLTRLRIDGANHGFAVDGDQSYAGFSEVLTRAPRVRYLHIVRGGWRNRSACPVPAGVKCGRLHQLRSISAHSVKTDHWQTACPFKKPVCLSYG